MGAFRSKIRSIFQQIQQIVLTYIYLTHLFFQFPQNQEELQELLHQDRKEGIQGNRNFLFWLLVISITLFIFFADWMNFIGTSGKITSVMMHGGSFFISVMMSASSYIMNVMMDVGFYILVQIMVIIMNVNVFEYIGVMMNTVGMIAFYVDPSVCVPLLVVLLTIIVLFKISK